MVKMTVIGAGMRGTHAYGRYAEEHKDEVSFVAVADPNPERREYFRKVHNIPEEMCFENWEELLKQPRMADAAIVSTQDTMHYEPTMAAIEKGYHVLLEKPMATTPEECVAMGEFARERNQLFMICHVLRYSGFFRKLKELLDEGRIGKLISIQHNENVGYYHQAHSYVRGNWRNSGESSPMILAKSCHDMDILLWLTGSDCKSISSFGELSFFKEENAPEGAPLRCTDGCPAEKECPYFAPRHYLKEELTWLQMAISDDHSLEGRRKALEEGPYGRCVFRCDNDVVDHQVVNMEFENGVTAAFTMCAFSKEINRTIKLMGTLGEIRGNMEKNEIEIRSFLKDESEVIVTSDVNGDNGHGGGDAGIMEEFIRLLENGCTEGLTSADVSVQSHLMAFAAEKSRLEKCVVHLDDFKKEIAANIRKV